MALYVEGAKKKARKTQAREGKVKERNRNGQIARPRPKEHQSLEGKTQHLESKGPRERREILRRESNSGSQSTIPRTIREKTE